MGPERLLLIECSAMNMAQTTKDRRSPWGGELRICFTLYGEGRIHRGVIRGESDIIPKDLISETLD